MKKSINLFLISLGLLVLLLIFWFRFLRERLPREIPFQLTEVGLLIILIIIITHLLIIIKYFSKSKEDVMVRYLLAKMQAAITSFFELIILFFKGNPKLNPLFTKSFIFFILRIKSYNYFKVYLLLELLPRLILLSVFSLDVFYFNCIKLFYQIILIGLIIFIVKIILYFLKAFLNKNLRLVDERAELYCYNIENDGEIGSVPQLTAKEFVEERRRREEKGLEDIIYLPSFRLDYVQDLRTRLVIPKTHSFNADGFTKNMRQGLNLAQTIYNVIYLYEQAQSKYKKIIVMLSPVYLIAWIYILIKSIHTLKITMFTLGIKDLIEPFSGIIL